MNGPHDMGGMQCYGPTRPEKDEPIFHHPWERQALALTVAMGATGTWNIDMSRHARESLEPVKYLSSSYYQIWTEGLEKLLMERGLVTREELETRKSATPGKALSRVPDGAMMKAGLATGSPCERVASSAPLFGIGQSVRSVNMNPPGHTRLPRYVRGKIGVVERVAGCHVFPDSNAHGKGENPHWLYTVRFDGAELFGDLARHSVMVDCWEPYLEAR
jgi:nitrile hydratase subunit beta